MKNLVLLIVLFFGFQPVLPVQADRPDSGIDGAAQILHMRGPIGPATADFIRDGFETARSRNAQLIILAMDTPGGLSESMRAIIRSILDSPVPVVGFVFPSGSRAASAGTYILYATHIAAMAPGTNLGAATPIKIGGGDLPLPGKEKAPPGEDGKKPSAEKPSRDAMEAKIVNDAAAYIRSLAEMRGRNADWAEQSVREGVSLPVNEALEKNVIDVVASDIGALLRKIDGREVTVADRRITLNTAGLKTETIAPGWRIRLLSVLTNPNIAFILILVGVYGLIFEFANPGSIGPGVVGVICLLLGFYALNVLPLNHAGLGLLIFSIALMVAEAFVPSFGILGIGGIVAFVLAAMMLFEGDIPGFGISWPVIVVTAAVSGGLMIFLLGYAWRAQRRPITTGMESLVGKQAEVLEWSGNKGYVRIGGERWKAVGKADVAPHDRVEVCESKDLVLVVQKKL
jgi:membrane-bound serine protease (ClpP class)